MAETQPTLFDLEEWRPIPQWENLYEVSSHGQVRSLDRMIVRSNGFPLRTKGRILKPSSNPHGYLHVILCRDGKEWTRAIHRLVLEGFVGLRPDGMEGCHNDGNKRNNHISNLRWDTQSENVLDRVRHGTHHEARKTHCPRGHLLEQPNLRAALARKGHRGCLSCDRAKGYVRFRPPLKAEFQKISDSYYSQIMGGTA